MICEMCGSDVAVLVRTRVEGSVLRLCSNCQRFGMVLDPIPPATSAASPSPTRRLPPLPPETIDERVALPRRRLEERDLYQEMPEMDLAPDWNLKIRRAREALNWTPEELGKKLNEKKSLVLKLESGEFRPPDATIRKVEHVLKIRLRAEASTPTE